MTLDQIMQSDGLSDYGKAQQILIIDGRGGKYTVADLAHDDHWRDNGTRFRSLRTARAFATLMGPNTDVVGPDATIYEPLYEPKANAQQAKNVGRQA